MSIELNTALCIWYVPLPTGDWLCAASQETDGSMSATYRFRYYDPRASTSPDANDKKNWYELRNVVDSTEAFLATMDAVASQLADRAGTNVDFVDLRGLSVDARMDALLSRSWAHVSTAGMVKGGQA